MGVRGQLLALHGTRVDEASHEVVTVLPAYLGQRRLRPHRQRFPGSALNDRPGDLDRSGRRISGQAPVMQHVADRADDDLAGHLDASIGAERDSPTRARVAPVEVRPPFGRAVVVEGDRDSAP